MTNLLETPGRIERQFRHELGGINPYLCLVDSAVECFVSEAGSKPDKAKFLRSIAEQYGHYNLYTEHLNLVKLRRFVHLNHILLINSKAEAACKRLQNLDIMLGEAKNIAEKDFLRKTIAIAYSSMHKDSTLAKNVKEEIYQDYIGINELKVVDYFRLLRNSEIHYIKNKDQDKLLDIFDSIDQEWLSREYKLSLNDPNCLNSKDVLLLSRLWQTVVKRLCRKCVNIHDTYKTLSQTYKGISNETRRKKKIMQILKQEYLQTDEEINIIV